MAAWQIHQLRNLVGWAADACPVCHGVTAFRIEQLSTFVGTVSKETQLPVAPFFERTCGFCGVVLLEPSLPYVSLAPSSEMGISELVQKTQPRVYERFGREWPLNNECRDGELSPEAREEILMAGAVACSYFYESRIGADRVPLYLQIAIIVGVCGGAMALSWHRRHDSGALTEVILLSSCVSGFLVYRVVEHRKTADVRRQVVSNLARAFAPFSPTQCELRRLQQKLAARRLLIARVVGSRRLSSEMRRQSELA